MARKNILISLGLGALLVAAAMVVSAAAAYGAKTQTSSTTLIELTGTRAQVEQFIRYDQEIQLTPAEEKIRHDALAEMPAPCCKDYSAATCCCPCNLSRSTWGMTKYLITKKGANANQVRAAAVQWVKLVNPLGFSGTSCYEGFCGRSFKDNGCGGMSADDLVY